MTTVISVVLDVLTIAAGLVLFVCVPLSLALWVEAKRHLDIADMEERRADLLD